MDVEQAWACLAQFDKDPGAAFKAAIEEAAVMHLADMEEQGREEALKLLLEIDERYTAEQHEQYLEAVFTLGRAFVAAH